MSEPRSVSPTTGRWVLASTILASSMAFIDGSALNVALPALQHELNASAADLLWVSSGYLLMLASLILVGGSLGDIYGRKRIFGAGIVLFTVASVACGLAPTAPILIASRFIQGIGGALMVPGSLAIISALFPAERRGRAIGTWSSFSTLTTILGPLLGGYLAGIGFWRGVFLINIPLAVIALAILIFKVPENRDESASRSVDLLGGALAAIGLGALTYGFISAPERGLSDPIVAGGFIVGVISLIAFVVWEARTAHPMMPLSVFKSRTFTGANLLTLFLYAALNAVAFFLPLNLVQIQGYPEVLAGSTFLPFVIMLTVMGRWAGGLVDKVGPRLPLVIGAIISGIGMLILSFAGLTRGPQDYWTTFFPGILVWGFGMGIVVAPLTTAVMGSVSQDRAGVASGVNNAVARTAGVLAIAIFGAIAVSLYQSTVDRRAATLDLPSEVQAELHQQALKLGNAEAPESAPAAQQDEITQVLRQSFVDVFRVIAWISTGLAWISALLAALVIEPRLRPT